MRTWRAAATIPMAMATAFVLVLASTVSAGAAPSGISETDAGRGFTVDFSITGTSVERVKELIANPGGMVIRREVEGETGMDRLFKGTFRPGDTITIQGTVTQKKTGGNYLASIDASISAENNARKVVTKRTVDSKPARAIEDVTFPFTVTMEIPQDAVNVSFAVSGVSTDVNLSKREQFRAYHRLNFIGILERAGSDAVRPPVETAPEPKPCPDLAVSAEAIPLALPGQPLTYTLSVVNNGEADAEKVSFTTELSTDLPLAPGGISGSDGFECRPVEGSSSRFGCEGTLASGHRATVELNVVAPEEVGAAIECTAAASVVAGQKEERLDNNSAMAVTTVGAGATDLSVALAEESQEDQIATGESFSRRFLIYNNGRNLTQEIEFQVSIPLMAADGRFAVGYAIERIEIEGYFTCELTPNGVGCSNGAIGPGEYATINLVGTGSTSPGRLTITAAVDPKGRIVESLEDNNSVEQTITFN